MMSKVGIDTLMLLKITIGSVLVYDVGKATMHRASMIAIRTSDGRI